MGDKRDYNSWLESEFGIGENLLDPVSRVERTLSAEQEMMEIYALPKTFDGSGAGLPGGERPSQETTPVPRLLPGETEEDRA
jgi:hypothetical protein